MNTIPIVIELDTVKRLAFLVKCDKFDEIIDPNDNIKTHIETLHGKVFKCKMCDYVFPTEAILKDHSGNVHEAYVMGKCNPCEQMYRSKDALENHVVTAQRNILESTFLNPSIAKTN